MFYVFSHTLTAADTEASPKEIKMQMTAGIIHQVDVLFQEGCLHEVFAQIFDDNVQVWPSNRGEKLRGDSTIISFRDFYELKPGSTELTLRLWTTLTTDFKEIIVQLGLLPKQVLQPMSFEELLKAATGF